MTSRPKTTAAFHRSALACLVLLASTPAVSFAQTRLGVAEAPGHGRWTQAVDRARDLVSSYMDSTRVPGVSVAVAVDGTLVWAEGFGWADVENQVPVTPRTRFRIASISKAVTSAGVMKLVEAGRLDLDAPVQRYVPGFPEKPEGTITTRLLAGHLAGVRHYATMEEFESTVHYDDVVDALQVFANDPLVGPPGAQYEYSTWGWCLISAVVQGASGVPFLAFMRQEVLDPLGLEDIVAEYPDSVITGRGRQYRRTEDGRLVNAPYVDNSNKWAGGGYLSTAAGLARYGSAYLTSDFLKPETVQRMWTSQRTAAGDETGYGIGWSVGTRDGRREVFHTGGAVGGSTVLLIWPDEKIVVALLFNLEGAGRGRHPRDIAGFFATAARR